MEGKRVGIGGGFSIKDPSTGSGAHGQDKKGGRGGTAARPGDDSRGLWCRDKREWEPENKGDGLRGERLRFSRIWAMFRLQERGHSVSASRGDSKERNLKRKERSVSGESRFFARLYRV